MNPMLRQFLVVSAAALAVPASALADPDFGGPGRAHHAMHRMHGMHDMHGMHGGHGGHGMLPFLRRLDLSEAQQDKVFSIMHELAPKMREQGKIARKARTDLRELSLSDKFDETKARTLADAQARAHADMALLRAKSTQQVFALLTPEQRKKFEELKAERGRGMGPGEDGPRGPRGPQGPDRPHMRHGAAADDWDPLAARGEL